MEKRKSHLEEFRSYNDISLEECTKSADEAFSVLLLTRLSHSKLLPNEITNNGLIAVKLKGTAACSLTCLNTLNHIIKSQVLSVRGGGVTFFSLSATCQSSYKSRRLHTGCLNSVQFNSISITVNATRATRQRSISINYSSS